MRAVQSAILKTILSIVIGFACAYPVQAQQPGDEDAVLEYLNKPWKGDLDGMLKRKFIRVLTVYNPLFFGFDGKEIRGLAIDISREFQKHLHKTLRRKARGVRVVLVPVPRDRLLPGLIEGRGDIAAANLTITRARKKLVDFGNPSWTGVKELVVTGPTAPDIKTFDDLASVPVHIRTSSSYFEHLSKLNQRRKKEGKKQIRVINASEHLEDYDLLEMMNVGLIPAAIVDSHKVALWKQVFEKIKVHEELAVNSGGGIAWAFRKGSPKLKKTINSFVKKMHKGSLLGNILIRRYLKTTRWIDNVRSPKAREQFDKVSAFIQKFARKYDFDWLMIAAQGYQESKLDQSKRSKAGAIGVMQVMPTTAKDRRVNISNIDIAEHNIHAGIKYLRFLRSRYFNDPKMSPLDRVLFSFAAYNAGPANIARARRRAARKGFDRNRWFGHVEVGAARVISREPVTYVRNIFKYYATYSQLRSVGSARKKLLRKMK